MNREAYLAGEWSHGGWWYYYLYALAIKVPLGTWLLLLLAVAASIRFRAYRSDWLNTVVLLSPAILVLVFVSANPGINRHFRYAMPMLPFVFIWISRVFRSFESGDRRVAAMAGTGLAWTIGSSLLVYPHCGSYFNELAGGPRNGHAHLISSNIDWGQDLLFLKSWLDDHKVSTPFGLAYYGSVDPRIAGINYSLPPFGGSVGGYNEAPAPHESGPRPGWYAISVHLLRGSRAHVCDGTGERRELPSGCLTYFLNVDPSRWRATRSTSTTCRSTMRIGCGGK